jgi:hypothetical protein
MASTEGPVLHHEGTITSIDVSDRGDVEKLMGIARNRHRAVPLRDRLSAARVFMFNFPFSVGAGNEFGTPAGLCSRPWC